MDYFESAEDVKITKARALRELAKHGVDDAQSVQEFYAELGDHETYDAQAVLGFLGY